MASIINNRGVGVVEIVVVAGITSLVLVSILQLLVLSTRPVGTGIRETQANFYAEEAIEAVRLLRNTDWSDNIANKTSGTTYYPVLSSNNWTLSTTNPGNVDGIFERTVVLGDVYRDTNDNINSVGTLDSKTRKVTATVAWDDHGQAKSVVIETYVTNFLGT